MNNNLLGKITLPLSLTKRIGAEQKRDKIISGQINDIDLTNTVWLIFTTFIFFF